MRTLESRGKKEQVAEGTVVVDPYLHHMICFFPNPICKTEAVEYFQSPALQTVRLPVEDFCAAFVNDSSVYAAMRHPRGHHQAW
jgi:hypothetical protein